MQLFRRYPAMLLVAVLFSAALTACGENKISQCNKLSNVVNRAAKETQSIGQSNNADKFAELNKAADSLDSYAKELEGLSLKDETLKGFKDRFVKMYADTSRASRALVAAAKKRDINAGNGALRDLQKATSQEDPLVKEVNDYCRK